MLATSASPDRYYPHAMDMQWQAKEKDHLPDLKWKTKDDGKIVT